MSEETKGKVNKVVDIFMVIVEWIIGLAYIYLAYANIGVSDFHLAIYMLIGICWVLNGGIVAYSSYINRKD